MEDLKQYWDQIYQNKEVTEVSWYEPMPENSLKYIEDCELENNAAILDVGGGDSFLVEFLVAKGFTGLEVLDISASAIERARKRMGDKAEKVQWIVEDITRFQPQKKYELWHDRAAFHFLTEPDQQERYLKVLREAVKPGGFVIISTFSEDGPDRCSGLKVAKYSASGLQDFLGNEFITLGTKNIDHQTPSGTKQNFTFCYFKRKV